VSDRVRCSFLLGWCFSGCFGVILEYLCLGAIKYPELLSVRSSRQSSLGYSNQSL
jgi:hypothetical protein